MAETIRLTAAANTGGAAREGSVTLSNSDGMTAGVTAGQDGAGRTYSPSVEVTGFPLTIAKGGSVTGTLTANTDCNRVYVTASPNDTGAFTMPYVDYRSRGGEQCPCTVSVTAGGSYTLSIADHNSADDANMRSTAFTLTFEPWLYDTDTGEWLAVGDAVTLELAYAD